MVIRRRALTLVLIASVVQIYLLSYFSFANNANKISELIIVSFILVSPLFFIRRKAKFIVELITVTAAFGGLGMLVGSLLDAQFMPLHGGHHHTSEASIISWSNGLMIAFCFTACFYLCSDKFSSVTSKVTLHLLCSIAMFIGMVMVSSFVTKPIHSSLSIAASTHIAMILGMQVGVCIPELIRVIFFHRENCENCHPYHRKKRLH